MSDEEYEAKTAKLSNWPVKLYK